MRRIYLIYIGLCLCGLLAGIARSETFQLNDGRMLSGEIVSHNESGLIVRLPDGAYSDRVPWSKFSQADLKKLAKNPRIKEWIEPFIEVTPEERIKKTEVEIKPVPRLERPEARSLLGAMASSSVGLVALLLLYAANLFAAYEIALFRAQPVSLVCGLAAIPLLGFLAPVVFLALPTRLRRSEEEEYLAETAAKAPPAVKPAASHAKPAARTAQIGGLRLTHSDAAHASAMPQTQTFQRGAFTFNRRFFETRFPGFFSIARHEADKDLVLVIKSARGQFVGDRITRITSDDLHLQVSPGPSGHEAAVPFTEIQEVQLKHRDA